MKPGGMEKNTGKRMRRPCSAWRREAGAVRGRLNDRDAKCPFFCAHTRQAVICEDLIPGSRAKHNFASTQEKDRHYKGWCCARYKYCEQYIALQRA